MESLIELIKERPLLYDCKHPDFRCQEKKLIEWDAIAKLMGSETGE